MHEIVENWMWETRTFKIDPKNRLIVNKIWVRVNRFQWTIGLFSIDHTHTHKHEIWWFRSSKVLCSWIIIQIRFIKFAWNIQHFVENTHAFTDIHAHTYTNAHVPQFHRKASSKWANFVIFLSLFWVFSTSEFVIRNIQ